MASVSFSISGSAITDTCRDMVLDGRWREALQDLKECFDDDLDDQTALDVLAGKKRFAGRTGTEEGVHLLDDDTERGAQYRGELDFAFAGCVSIDRRLYQPRQVITDYGPRDEVFRVGAPEWARGFLSERQQAGLKDADRSILLARAEKYARSNDAKVMFCRATAQDGVRREYAVVFEPAPDAPLWFRPQRTPQEAVDAAGSALEFTGHSRLHGSREEWIKAENRAEAEREAREGAPPREREDGSVRRCERIQENPAEIERREAAWREEIATRSEAILKQNAELGYGLRSVDFGEKYGVRQVPVAPLLVWAGERLRKFGDLNAELPEWKSVNPSGVKLSLDDPNHTDWMMAAGLVNADYWEIGNVMDRLCQDVQNELAGVKVHVLVAGKPWAQGTVRFCGPRDEVDGDTVAVIKRAGPEYWEIARNAAAVITLAGGSMSHLAVHGLDEGFLIVRDEDARKKYEDGDYVQIDVASGTVTKFAGGKPELTAPPRI